MERRRIAFRKTVKYLLFFLILTVLYILQSTPGFLSLFGIKPIFVIPFCVVLAALNDEWQAFLIVILGGLYTDLGSMRVAGYFTLMLLFVCVASTVSVKFFFKATPRNAYFYSLVSMLVMLLLDFLFSYVMNGYRGLLPLLFRNVLLLSRYSSLFAIPFYYLIDNINIMRSLRVSER